MPAAQSPLTIAHVDAEVEFSGGEEQVFLLIEGLRRRGHRNILFCPPGSSSEEAAREREIETRGVPMRNDMDLPAVLRLRRELAGSGADLVHLNSGRATWLGGMASHLTAMRALTTRRQDRTVKRNWKTRLIYERFVRRAVAISPAVADELQKGGVDPERIVTIPEAVDPERLQTGRDRGELRAALGLEEGDFALLTMAKLVPRKGIDVLLEAVARIPAERRPVTLIGGDGPEQGRLEEQAAALGLGGAARFLGWRRDKPELLKACDAFVLPSRREGLGVAALEAMGAGRPVIASAIGGLGEVVQDGKSGLLVPPGDAEGLRGAILRMQEEPGLREALGRGARERIRERHLAERMVDAYVELYREVLAEGRP